MATSAWVDWSKLPDDVITRVVDMVNYSGEGNEGMNSMTDSYGFLRGEVRDARRTMRDGPHYDYYDARDKLDYFLPRMKAAYRAGHVQAGEHFHRDADRTTPMERAKYAAMTALAVGTVGLGLASWQSTPKDERSKANTNASPEPTAKAISAKSEL